MAIRHLHRPDDNACIPDSTEPIGEEVSHCNQRTEYELIEHIYQPDSCDECKMVSDLFSNCTRGK